MRTITRSSDEVRICVRVQARARTNAIVGHAVSGIRVRLTAPPVDGAANDALIALLAATLGVSRSAVRIVVGATSRNKVVAIRGLSEDDLRRALPPLAQG